MKHVAFVLIFVCAFCTLLNAGEIYEWIDEDGVKHFSNEPPPPGAKTVKEAEEIGSDSTSNRKSGPEETGTLKKDTQPKEASTGQATAVEILESGDSVDDNTVDSDFRPKEAERRHDQRKAERKAKSESARGDITDRDEEANLGDPEEKANMGDPDERDNIGDPDERKNIGDPEEKKDFEQEKF
jgi:hypothetical protein